MRNKWMHILMQLTTDFDRVNQINCPNCKECEIDYLYIGEASTRVGFLQVWCKKCLKGIYVSRAVAPQNAKFVTFDTDIKDLIPSYEFVDD